MKNFVALKDLVDSLVDDNLKATEGNKAAGVRLRVGMNKAVKLAKSVKLESLGKGE